MESLGIMYQRQAQGNGHGSEFPVPSTLSLGQTIL